MSGSVSLLPLCSIPKLASRDGDAGAYAHEIIPFLSTGNGIYFFSGQIGSFPDSTAPQNNSPTMRGNHQINTFTKDCCNCLVSGGDEITYVAP